ncbi:unnamed protein product [Darwinula stevensoni]|uniref:SCP domain-containing protein n=1 Tax=Darwinula stevensoni TaxID=69355 RepID=A0A7R8XB51_9CRUS|nr:unnamed protein product [Darwinula stevensoni]CAG0890915.1 unnamed protein product [Darwinula stevensoni]
MSGVSGECRECRGCRGVSGGVPCSMVRCLTFYFCAARFYVGQNLYITWAEKAGMKADWKRAIQAFYDEVPGFSPYWIQPFRFSESLGHYTQMMWAETHRVGCGFIMYQNKGYDQKLYTCNYGPAGNRVRSSMYTVGPPCSQCPAGARFCNAGLCCGQCLDAFFASSDAVSGSASGSPIYFSRRVPFPVGLQDSSLILP